MNSLILVGIALFLGLLWYVLESEAKDSVDEMEYFPPCSKGLCDGSGLIEGVDSFYKDCPCRV